MTLLASLRDWLKAQQLDAVLLSSRQNKQPHLGISTGSGYVVISRESAHILVDSRYYVEVEARAQGYQLHLLDATNTLTTIVNQIIADEQLQTLGFEGQQVSWETAHRWKSELNAKLVSATPDVLRQIKTPEEVEIIRLACGIADRGAEHIRRFIQAGMSEREIAAELEWFMRQQGAEKASFDTIVASGWRGALPHGKASDKIVAAGEFVTLDFGALYQGYCSDMTRTLLVNGEGVSAESHPLFDVYQIVLQAQLAAISAIRPGVRCQQIDDAARRVITEAGFGDYFGHNTGHAIGIEVHEDPRFSPRDTTTLQPGMLLIVEPGIYLPGQGGVRIEDVVLVTPQGAEVLYAMPKTVLLTGEADAIASSEQEVRQILLEEADRLQKEVRFDGLGSVLIRLNESTGPKVMICAHMDEVGFMVRSISREGAIDVLPVGNVRMAARQLQPVRITTREECKIPGLLDGDRQGNDVSAMRVDIGARSYDEVMQAGIRPGDRVTFDTTFQVLPHQRVMGKAFDDRLGCYLLVTLLRELHDAELPAEVWLVASSSEEVGLRGGQTATRAVSPDVAIVLDTACWAKNFDYSAANHRQIGNGPMLVLSDKSLIAPPKLTAWIETVAAEIGVPLQADMFSNGGTDGGAVHLTGTGVPTVVMGPATRHGHCAASIADCRDILQMQQLLSALIQRLTRETVVQLTDFR
ncbi:aminopeptidase [Shigella sonnei]|nr:aminopeptidase [Shigella sonnei]